MGRTQYSYDYPEVPQPHPQTRYVVESPPANARGNNRYSWMEPAEEQNTQHTHATKRQSTAPPLPVVPEHLNHDFQRQQQVVREQQQSQLPPQFLPPPQPQPQPQAVSQQNETATYQRATQVSQQPDRFNMQQQQLPHSHPQSQETKPIHKPDPVKTVPDHPNYRRPVMPDENPLRPTSIADRKVNVGSQTSGLTTVIPTTSDYAFANYVPVPQTTNGGTWTHSLYSCSEPTICMTGLFCPCVLYGRLQHRLHLKSDRKDATNMLGYNTVNGSCVAWAFLCGINGILSGIQKSRVRRTYEMDSGSGNIFSDCLQGCCCCCCVLAQNEKEIKLREEEGKKTITQEAYVPPTGMIFAPPPSHTVDPCRQIALHGVGVVNQPIYDMQG